MIGTPLKSHNFGEVCFSAPIEAHLVGVEMRFVATYENAKRLRMKRPRRIL